MAITVDYQTKVISVPQADLTHVSGTLYELDTDAFRLTLADLQDDEEGMPFPTMFQHNTEVTVAGTTYARTIEIINGYSIEFEDGQYTVKLVGSNNNIFDVQNGILVQNQVQVIPTNSAGLITTTVPAVGLTPEQEARLLLLEKIARNKMVTDPVAGTITIYDNDDSVLISGDLWEDASGTQQYRGQGAERRERMT
jgi:hypothetical protein